MKHIFHNTLFLFFLGTYSRTILSLESFLGMSFSADNMQIEYKYPSVMAHQNLFCIKESFKKFLSASQLERGSIKYSLSTVVILGNTSHRCCSQIN